jgi:hypothetical protein
MIPGIAQDFRNGERTDRKAMGQRSGGSLREEATAGEEDSDSDSDGESGS